MITVKDFYIENEFAYASLLINDINMSLVGNILDIQSSTVSNDIDIIYYLCNRIDKDLKKDKNLFNIEIEVYSVYKNKIEEYNNKILNDVQEKASEIEIEDNSTNQEYSFEQYNSYNNAIMQKNYIGLELKMQEQSQREAFLKNTILESRMIISELESVIINMLSLQIGINIEDSDSHTLGVYQYLYDRFILKIDDIPEKYRSSIKTI